MPCHECIVDEKPPTDPPCKLCAHENRSCTVDELVHDAPCAPEDCRLAQHGCRFVVGPQRWQRCKRHRDLPLDADKDHYVCSEHLAEQLLLEEHYPSVVMSKCAAPGCWGSRCLPVPGENELRYCKAHANDRRKEQRPTSWARPRPQVIEALRGAGLQGMPWDPSAAVQIPAVAACYKTRSGAHASAGACALVHSHDMQMTRHTTRARASQG